MENQGIKVTGYPKSHPCHKNLLMLCMRQKLAKTKTMDTLKEKSCSQKKKKTLNFDPFLWIGIQCLNHSELWFLFPRPLISIILIKKLLLMWKK